MLQGFRVLGFGVQGFGFPIRFGVWILFESLGMWFRASDKV